MDRRHRVYYLVNLNQNYKRFWWMPGYDSYGFTYEHNLNELRRMVSSLKIIPNIWGRVPDDYYQLKVSCKKREEELLVGLLDTLKLVNYVKVA